MIETLSIILHFLVITIFCYAPNSLCSLIIGKKNPDIINRLEAGLVFNLFLLLILSFILRSGSNLIYYFLTIVFLINFLFLLKDLFVNYKFKNLEINFIFLLSLFFADFISSFSSEYLSKSSRNISTSRDSTKRYGKKAFLSVLMFPLLDELILFFGDLHLLIEEVG